MDTPTPEYVVPVIAQRLFGQNYPGISIERGFPVDDRFPREDRGPGFVISGSLGTGPPVIDRTQGTTRPWPEIEAMFTPNSSSGFSDGSTVNDLWQRTGIRFELIDRIDTPISSAMANFLPRSSQLRGPITKALLRPGGVNFSMLREIEGSLAFAKKYRPKDPDYIPFVMMSDMHRWASASDPLHHWRSSLVVLAHELGHVLGLGHVAFPENVMFGRGTKLDSVQLTLPQIATCRYRAAYLSGAMPLSDSSPGA